MLFLLSGLFSLEYVTFQKLNPSTEIYMFFILSCLCKLNACKAVRCKYYFSLIWSLFCLFQGAVSGSVQASDRLMKELRDIYRSQSYKTGKMLQISLNIHFERILLANASC